MEEELSHAVVITVLGTRPVVDLANAAALLHSEFGIGPLDMSIYTFHPEDFLVLCRTQETRNRMVTQGRATSPRFMLSLRPWMRQAQATRFLLSHVVPLALVGMPVHALTRRTTTIVLAGLAIIVDVARPTMRQDDMSRFTVWLGTSSLDTVPAHYLLFIEESRGARRQHERQRSTWTERWCNMLHSLIDIFRITDDRQASRAQVLVIPPSPLSSDPPSPSSSGRSSSASAAWAQHVSAMPLRLGLGRQSSLPSGSPAGSTQGPTSQVTVA